MVPPPELVRGRLDVVAQGIPPSGDDFRLLVARSEQGDGAALLELYQLVHRHIENSCQPPENDPEYVSDAANHVLLQIWLGKLPANVRRSADDAKGWIVTVAQNRMRTQLRQRSRGGKRTRRMSELGNGNVPPEVALARCSVIPDAEHEPPAAASARWRQLVRQLTHCHRWAATQLSERRGRAIDYVAVYWLFFRTRLYQMLLSGCQRETVLHADIGQTVADAVPWDSTVEALRPKDGWPQLATVWRAWQGYCCRQGRVGQRTVTAVVTQLVPEAKASPATWYQWIRRMRQALAETVNEDFPPDELRDAASAMAWTFWYHVVFRDELPAPP